MLVSFASKDVKLTSRFSELLSGGARLDRSLLSLPGYHQTSARGLLPRLSSSGGPEKAGRSHDPRSSSPPEGMSRAQPSELWFPILFASPSKSKSGPCSHLCGLTRYFWQDPNKRRPAQDIAVVMEGMDTSGTG